MKNFTISIISIALLWSLSGCLYHGDHHVSGYYSHGYPYAHSYYGAYYDGYPWAYPFGYFSIWYSYDHIDGYYPYKVYDHRPFHRDPHKRDIHKRHDGDRTHKRQLWQNEDCRLGRHQLQHERPRQERRIVREVTRPKDRPVLRSERRVTGERNLKLNNKANGRRLRCADGNC